MSHRFESHCTYHTPYLLAMGQLSVFDQESTFILECPVIDMPPIAKQLIFNIQHGGHLAVPVLPLFLYEVCSIECVTGYQVIRPGYSDICKNLSVRIALLGKIDYWICSIRNNRFVHLHSEVLRYSSSASTIRPLFEYMFMMISGYAFTILHVRQ